MVDKTKSLNIMAIAIIFICFSVKLPIINYIYLLENNKLKLWIAT